MTELLHEIVIERPIEEVFQFATAPRYWPQWHPSTVSVDLSTQTSLLENQTVVEVIKVGLIKDTVTWTVREHEAPNLWVIQGLANNGGTAVLEYDFSKRKHATHFRRVLNYQTPNLFMSVGDKLIGKRLMAKHSQQALQTLKALLENK